MLGIIITAHLLTGTLIAYMADRSPEHGHMSWPYWVMTIFLWPLAMVIMAMGLLSKLVRKFL